jgi:hypothetical protein
VSLVCKMQLVFEAYLWLMPIAICRWRCVNIARMRCGDLRGKTNAKRGANRRRGSASGLLFFLPRNPQLDEVLPRGFPALFSGYPPPGLASKAFKLGRREESGEGTDGVPSAADDHQEERQPRWRLPDGHEGAHHRQARSSSALPPCTAPRAASAPPSAETWCRIATGTRIAATFRSVCLRSPSVRPRSSRTTRTRRESPPPTPTSAPRRALCQHPQPHHRAPAGLDR